MVFSRELDIILSLYTSKHTENRICFSGDLLGETFRRTGRGGVDTTIVVFLRWWDRRGEEGGDVGDWKDGLEKGISLGTGRMPGCVIE